MRVKLNQDIYCGAGVTFASGKEYEADYENASKSRVMLYKDHNKLLATTTNVKNVTIIE
jgi:hypothetical protein